MENVLTVNQLGKSFKKKRIIQDISFDVRKGEIMAILGPNGAGKSTTIRNIMGIMYPDEGTITFHNHIANEIPRHKIGYLPEERGLYKNVKVMDMILYLADLKDYPVKKARERALAYLAKFDLEGKEKVSVEELSKGMGQKVQFIASIIHEPELLILDEPFSGLDPVSQELFKREIRELANNGTAILLSSHQMNVVEQLCDRLFMIHRGQKVIYGTMEDVKNQYANFKCRIRGKNDLSLLEKLSMVQRVEQSEDVSILYLTQDVNIPTWLRQLPESLHIQELSIDRISLHEIFIDVATDNHLLQESGDNYA
ncbi:ABC transporter ATP-binding protein [Lederbergia lenta]|uniref:Na+ efflux ABC transporter ATP-binding protein n=1 Tax=Lederbergia lenta TaxID=1467 RepID=A0A2X4VL98_LEDLE|nr:ATP-binding cassette domain-containing protein [Lederbergia lenta]MCM3112663.1 ATP-binding cassette domain-containing protein [Lederbergia lenta]MEC2323701.1 ATP-binding cassette domain-containing protein [Lederbergia lenta]SQI51601.1 Na+ efflux ABC transporter ATP-binding protein [Lederbergia lenta]